MSSWRVTDAEERWLVLASRYRDKRKAPIFGARIGGWHSVNFVPRCALFALGLVMAGAMLSICHLLHLGDGTLAAGLVLVAAAEWLIVSRRLAFSGIEEALEMSGLLMIAFGIVDVSSDIAMALLAAAAFIMAGLRLSNPLSTTLGTIASSLALQLALGRGPVRIQSADMWAGLYCYVIAWLALGCSARVFRRPSYDHMVGWLIMVMPLAGYAWLQGNRLAPFLPLAYGITALLVGIRRRTHEPLLACMICMACVAFELRRLVGAPLEAHLIVEGCVALAIAATLDRLLRRPHAGITSQKVTDGEDHLHLPELVGVAAIAPGARADPASDVSAREGRFGGGGASGGY